MLFSYLPGLATSVFCRSSSMLGPRPTVSIGWESLPAWVHHAALDSEGRERTEWIFDSKNRLLTETFPQSWTFWMNDPLPPLQNGRNLLHCAAQRGHIQVMEFIMEHLEDMCVDKTDKVRKLFTVLFHDSWCSAELTGEVVLGLGRVSCYSQKPSCRLGLSDDGGCGSGQPLTAKPSQCSLLQSKSLLSCS